MRSATSAAWPPAPSVPVCGMLMPIFTVCCCARTRRGMAAASVLTPTAPTTFLRFESIGTPPLRFIVMRPRPLRLKVRSARSSGELDETCHVLAKPPPDGVVDEPARGVEHLAGIAHVEDLAEPGAHPQRAEDGQPGRLRQDGSERAWRGAHQPHGASLEDARHVAGWPRHPVDRVLEHARD